MTEDKAKDKPRPSYASYAFHNPYNYALMGGVGVVGLLTDNWWLLLAGLGLEILWMTFAPDSKVLQKTVWDPQFLEEQKEAKEANFNLILNNLYGDDYKAFCWILNTRREILRLSSSNPKFTFDLLREELEKVDTLTLLYGDLAATLVRYRAYLRSVDAQELEQERRRLERLASGPAASIHRKNLEILERRKEKLREISDYMTKARAQMDLIRSTFQLLADQVVTLQSPHELGSQLDELIDGVEAVRSVSRETEKFLQTA